MDWIVVDIYRLDINRLSIDILLDRIGFLVSWKLLANHYHRTEESKQHCTFNQFHTMIDLRILYALSL